MSTHTTPVLTRRDPRVKGKEKHASGLENLTPKRNLQTERSGRSERIARSIPSSPLNSARSIPSSPIQRSVPLARTRSEERVLAEREKKIHCSKIRNGTRNWSAKSNREQFEEIRNEVNDKLRQKIEMKQKHAEEKRQNVLFEKKLKALTMQQISKLNATIADEWE